MLYYNVVRVKPSELIDVSTDTMMFQFQYGTIKAHCIDADIYKNDEFQFQHGTIKAVKLCVLPESVYAFQFQHGTIKALPFISHPQKYLHVSIPTWYD
ncbi:hypothetical protein CDQ84_13960 [Clostridium thermosuccinogenes]|uniref:Uncharacterized protein n=1 Tax=Clostridium thermosuccinogenes TaxID=84032 RepID=A0A2K2FED5_9CLOT|nr:hypothetical protein [Pseudoclostridium thermosuccinogenes]AUS98339.1 hypothetical protein CDO33_18885 [Pseudoclostridium thermosuccinogenes]PNT95826.1 hypothetical protein CDQ85_13830 [Pseudoclostridium thermosuccinogenes]PNT97144.1 hypothetical protein CDQ84_13960 [Pseudoclostridium thermosuccinogenes]